MIVRIVEGGNTAGLVRYLFGEGRANEHTDQHIVAGSYDVMRRYLGWESLSSAQQGELAKLIDLNMRAHGVHVAGRVRGWNHEGGYEEISHGANHVWHASLSLSPEEEALSDEKWKAIADDFMTMMGYNGDEENPATCQWAAVRHGKAKNGGDHIHIVANVVRCDGTKVNRWYDQRRAQRAVNALEHKYGLRVIEAREHERGARADSAQALNRAKAQGAERTDRQILEQRLRAAAGAAATEADFISNARELGVRVRPRFAKGTTDVVTGYWAALHTAPGQDTQWWSATRIARDLTLSRLRDRWEDTPEGAMLAAQAWRAAWQGMPVGFDSRPTHKSYTSEEKVRALNTYYERLAGVNSDDRLALADATSDLAALYAAAAQQDGLSPGMRRLYDRLARSTGRHAQLHSRTPWKNPTHSAVRACAHAFLTPIPHTHGKNSHKRETLAAAMAMIRLSFTLANLYETARQAQTARDILRETQRLYDAVHRQPGVLEARAYYEQLISNAPLQQSTPGAVSTSSFEEAPNESAPQRPLPVGVPQAEAGEHHNAQVRPRVARISQPDLAGLARAARDARQTTSPTHDDYAPAPLPTQAPGAHEEPLHDAVRAVRAAQAMRAVKPHRPTPSPAHAPQPAPPTAHTQQRPRGHSR